MSSLKTLVTSIHLRKHVIFPVRQSCVFPFDWKEACTSFSWATLSYAYSLIFTRRVEHKNVLSVLGQATEQEPFLVILEHSSVVSNRLF